MGFDRMKMTSAQPYLVRAFFDWIVDNGMTPYLLVQADLPGVKVPKKHINDGKIVLNINPDAVHQLEMNNDYVQFNARFDGASMHIHFPVESILAVYAKENGQGMNFDLAGALSDDEGRAESNDASDDPPVPPRSLGRPDLKIVT